MAIWNQSAIGGFVTPASARIDRRPGQPSVNAVSSVSSVRPTVSRFRRISTAMSVSVLATAPNTCRPPSAVSTLPTRTSRCRSPSWQLRMKVESKVMVMADAAAAGLTAAALRSCSPTLSVWPRNVSGLFPASTGRRCCQHASGDAIGHQGGKMRSQLVQLRCRPTMRWPADTRLGAATASAAKPRQPHGHPAEQRRDLMKPPVLDVASPAAGRAIRPQNRMIVGLRGNHRLLNTRQKLLCLGQRQPQIRDIAKVVGPADLQHVDTPCPAVGPRFDQLQNPPHPRSPSRQRPDRSYRFRPYPPSSGHSPATGRRSQHSEGRAGAGAARQASGEARQAPRAAGTGRAS